MNKKKKVKQFLITLLFCVGLLDSTGYCEEDYAIPRSDENPGIMASIKLLLLDRHSDQAKIPPVITTPPVPPVIGARNIPSTPVEQGTLFASPGGSMDSCSRNTPCSIQMAFSQLSPGDVLFLRGGTYDLTSSLIPANSGLADNPIVIESFPGEMAILEGQYDSAADAVNNPQERADGVRLGRAHSYVRVRNIEVTHMGWSGVAVYGSHNIVEGCRIHNNISSGIVVYGGEWHEDDPDYQIPYQYGYNIIRDNISYGNSDVGLPANGGNADGISISSGRYNTIIHNTVYANSDDGIDTWRSNDSFVSFNRVYDNGRGEGNGNGIKAGGNLNPDATNGLRAVVEHNMAYDNSQRGIDYNAGHDVVFRYNTSYRNGTVGVQGAADTTVEYNIASDNGSQDSGLGTDNSWNIREDVPFSSTDPDSTDFLKPKAGSPFAGMGVYADLNSHQAKLFLIGDSTVHNDSEGEQGFGSRLGEYMINPDKVFNRARSGASSKSYRPDRAGTDHDWPGVTALISQTDTSEGAYLFIHFGHNDEDDSRPEQFTEPGRGKEFYNNLKAFIQEMKVAGVTSVLVTPVERMYKNRQSHITAHGDYPQTIRLLAEDEQVLLLDLQARSWNEFNTYADTEAIYNQFAYDDHTHFDPDGAKIVAGWLRDLICNSSDPVLCSQFK